MEFVSLCRVIDLTESTSSSESETECLLDRSSSESESELGDRYDL